MKISVSAAVSQEEKTEIDRYCKEHDIKIAQLIRWALRDYLNKMDKTNSVQ